MAFREWIFGENWWSPWLAFTVDFNIILWSRAAVIFIHQAPVDAALAVQVESTSSAAVLSWFNHVKSQLDVNREGKIQFLERAEAREWPSSHFEAISFYYKLTYISKLSKYFLCSLSLSCELFYTFLIDADGCCCHGCSPSKGPLCCDDGWRSTCQHCESAPEISAVLIAMMTQRCKHQHMLWGFGGNHIITVDKDTQHLLTSPQADKVHELLLTLINFPAINKKVRH